MRKEQLSARAKVKRTRTRSGCFTCRDRHMKCDEQLPVCQNCLTSKRKCIRGIRLNFTLYTFYDPKELILEPLELGTLDSNPSNLYSAPRHFAFLDQSVAVSSYYENGNENYRPYLHLHSQNDLLEASRQMSVDCNTSRAVTTLDASYIPPVIPQLPPNPETSRPDNPFPNQYHQPQHPLLLLRPPDPAPFGGSTPNPPHFTAPQQAPEAFFLSELNPTEPRENVILENYDITNLLTNPELQGRPTDFVQDISLGHQAFAHPGPRRSSIDLLEELPPESSVDAQQFTQLIHHFGYHWLLDLFNEINWWKVLMPNYCVRLAQAAEVEGKTPPGSQFLPINCLMTCSDDSSIDQLLDVAGSQFDEWEFLEAREVNVTTFRAFERILLSVTFITLALLLHLTLDQVLVLDKTFQLILTNQGMLFHKLMLRFSEVPSGRLKKFKQSPITVECIKAMTILRFMIKINIQTRNSGFSYSLVPTDPASVSQSVIDYNTTLAADWSHFFTVTPYEIELLNSQYAHLDLPQMDPYTLQDSKAFESDSKKLRDLMWELIKVDYLADNPELQGFLSVNEEGLLPLRVSDINTGRQLAFLLLTSNERALAMNFLSKRLDKLQHVSDQDTTEACAQMLRAIDSSSMDKRVKTHWHRHFSWVLEG